MNTEDRCTIVGKVVVKPGVIPDMFEHVGPDLFPDELKQYDGAYTYRFIEGRPAYEDDVPAILRAAASKLWLFNYDINRVVKKPVVQAYISHVHGLTNTLNTADHEVVERALRIIEFAGEPHAVTYVHGDLTLENVIVTPEEQVRFIDPADPRGMMTPANDKGKLLQSIVMRWEERNMGDREPWLDPRPLPTWACPYDWAFLVTHWVRLMRFWPELNTRSGFKSLQKVLR